MFTRNGTSGLYTTVADLRGGGRPRRSPPPHGPKCSQFHAVFWKFWQNHRLAPHPGGLALPPTGNPGSASAPCHAKMKPWFDPAEGLRYTPQAQKDFYNQNMKMSNVFSPPKIRVLVVIVVMTISTVNKRT